VDDLGAAGGFDGEVVEVGVVVDEDGGDGLGLVLPALRSRAVTLSPGLREAIGTVLPETSRTRVAVVKLFPPGISRGPAANH
jgi:hypothetical protein